MGTIVPCCANEAVFVRKFEGRSYCKDHFTESIEKTVKRTIRQNDLIERNDKIAVALSGGKDSSSVLYMLKKFFADRSDLTIFAIAIDEGIHGYRDKTLIDAKNLCDKLGVELHVVSFKEKLGKKLDEIVKQEKLGPCTYCGVFRRYLMNKTAHDLGATKLVTGHNLDDEAQSILMNVLKGDIQRMSRGGPKPHRIEHSKFVLRVKPLIYIPEREVALYAMLNDLPSHYTECPNVGGSVRFDVRDFLNTIEQKQPGTKHTMMGGYENLLPYIDGKVEMNTIKECTECGDPCSQGDICKKCELVKKVID